jgi:hypothetical protein
VIPRAKVQERDRANVQRYARTAVDALDADAVECAYLRRGTLFAATNPDF